MRKKSAHANPRRRQARVIFLVTAAKVFPECVSLISVIVGSSMVDTEAVIAEGNRMQGRAIPVRTPYKLRDSFKE